MSICRQPALDCGGKRSATPLWKASGASTYQPTVDCESGVALRLPPQSIKAGTLVLAALFLLNGAHSTAFASGHAPVKLTEDKSAYTLSNGIVIARVHKLSGDLLSLKYQGVECLGAGSGHPWGYWSHGPTRGERATASITIQPSKNGGERAEVSVKSFYAGDASVRTGNGPGGDTACDIEIRYALGRGDSGIYTYSIFTHPANYPATSIGEARFGTKLNPDVFDYMTIDNRRRKHMAKPADWDAGTELNSKEARRLNTGVYKGQVEHKYDYSAIQFDTPAYGWSSTERHVGLWFINPSTEYLSGGATKVELTGHLDNNEGGTPTLLNYWRGSHYGGSICVIGAGESWSKVIGPFLIYCNSSTDHEVMWKDALTKAARESNAWPYDWVSGVEYARKNERGKVEGQIVLSDPQAPNLKPSGLLVGLAPADYSPPSLEASSDSDSDESETPAAASTNRSNRASPILPQTVDWQLDAKFYQFWARGDARGRFTIPKVRPGTYTLHVIADGVLGEATKSNVTVAPGRTLDLGKLQWTPVRRGRQLWEIGVPNRSAEEFRHGDHYWQWGLYHQYTNDFPDGVRFVVGQSDYRKDWNYAQVPRSPRLGTTWSVLFPLTKAVRGVATLRLGIAAISLRSGIQVKVNDEAAGSTAPLADTATIRRDGIRGYWSERAVSFDAALLKAGTNVLTLSIPRGNAMTGVQYDYLRLELEETLNVAASRGEQTP